MREYRISFRLPTFMPVVVCRSWAAWWHEMWILSPRERSSSYCPIWRELCARNVFWCLFPGLLSLWRLRMIWKIVRIVGNPIKRMCWCTAAFSAIIRNDFRSGKIVTMHYSVNGRVYFINDGSLIEWRGGVVHWRESMIKSSQRCIWTHWNKERMT